MLQMKTKFYRIILILYSLLSIGSTIYLLMRPTDGEIKHQYKETKQELKQIKEYLKSKDSRYEQTIDSFKAKSDSLQNVIAITTIRLRVSRQHVNDLSTQLNQYVNRYETDTTLEKNAIAFDSLVGLSKKYVRLSKARDSLCNTENNSLKELVEVKDSVIGCSDSLLQDYKSSVEQLLLTTNDINEKLHRTEKKLKRKSRLNRVLSVGFVFVSGFLVSKIL